MNEKVLELLVGLMKLLSRIVIRHLPLTQGEKTLLNMRWKLLEDVVDGIEDIPIGDDGDDNAPN